MTQIRDGRTEEKVSEPSFFNARIREPFFLLLPLITPLMPAVLIKATEIEAKQPAE